MTIVVTKTAFVETAATTIALEKMFSTTAVGQNPAYLVVTTLDRNEYTATATGSTGTLSGNGRSIGTGSVDGDARGAGVVFTWQASTGQYVNASFGALSQATYTCSASSGDVTDLSLFGTSSLQLANADAASPYGMMQSDAAGYLGTATVVTQSGLLGGVPSQATPDAIANAARNFVGQAVNREGCWVLANTIATDAGAALPMQSTLVGVAGQANGEWIVAFNGPGGQSGNWQSLVHAGEVVVIGTPGGGGHITTCVSGAGASAMLVDNITRVTGAGQVLNSANDGSASDVIIEAPHAASVEWTGVQGSSVVIYQLDTPVVTDTAASVKLAQGASVSLASLFTAADPAGHAITEWQVYNSAAHDALVTGGVAHFGDTNATKVITAPSLGSVSLLAGTTATTDTLEVRAYNGSFWGDWQSIAVTVAKTATTGDLVPASTLSAGLALPMHAAAFQAAAPAAGAWTQVDHAAAALTAVAPGALSLTGTDLFSVDFAAAAGHIAPDATLVLPGMAALLHSPEPTAMLLFHS